jgi:dienelactone hydrolase
MERSLMRPVVITIGLGIAGLGFTQPRIQGRPAKYIAQSVVMKGTLAYDENVKEKCPGVVRAKILVLHGADDKFVPLQQVEAFKQEMQNASVDFQFISYPGAGHSFTNQDADKKSWEELKKFLEAIAKN